MDGNIKVLDREEPKITHGKEIIVRVIASSINPVDWKVAGGYMKTYLKISLPHTLGLDYAGVIVAKGEGVTEFEVGDEVYGKLHSPESDGTQAEFVKLNVDKDSVRKKPKEFEWSQAATIGVCGTTAWYCLVVNGRLDPFEVKNNSSKNVIVIGCSGGVGIFTCQILKKMGVGQIWGICSTRNAEFMKNYIGIDVVVDYTKGDLIKQLETKKDFFHLCVDCVGGGEYYNLASKGMLRKNGLFITITGPPDESPSLSSFVKLGFGILGKKLFGSIRYKILLGYLNDSYFQEMADFVERNGIIPYVGKQCSLEEVEEAYKESKSGRTRGKIVILNKSG
ncbi:GroES-like domain-containing protein [Rozella allomycis CSF55]|uniref:GroES-like domain-containing protein n=1 Tax=Rozella allomycis (strain CSF55) TaxID=988480 RepID=A0A075ATL7_ROZAC|nr:GroES-like domain-containing protein [Rozella allomycis CSF55]|eukprot:EPZ33520.1 GroES-like domain-containing protein [Rozella allomycis CSF55]